ncbi:MAG: hypothetical protein RLZZ299_1154 [Pseudomonadota bacterium]
MTGGPADPAVREGALEGLRVLVVDDDPAVRTALRVNLARAGCAVTLATSGEDALVALERTSQDAVVTDVRMGGMSGLALLDAIRTRWPDTHVVLMTGAGSVQDAVAAVRAGAADYLLKPFEREALVLVLARAVEARALRHEVRRLRAEVAAHAANDELIGSSAAMEAVRARLDAVADTSARVLLLGETGTGKELLARALHQRSRRARGPLVCVNCGALPESLLETELFGHERGAFTGAVRTHPGRFEQAHGGTLFLDEIGEIPATVQAHLLRVLEDGAVTRVGGTQPVQVDVRVVAATHRDLQAAVRAGSFRADLYYRLDVVRIEVPPLRARREDIPLLAEHFAGRLAARHGRPVPTLDAATLRTLQARDWPGNVRELQHLLERVVLLGPSAFATDSHASSGSGSSGGGGPAPLRNASPAATVPTDPESLADLPLPEALERWERARIVAALRAAGGVQAEAARRLGVSRGNLHQRIQRLGIVRRDVDYG